MRKFIVRYFIEGWKDCNLVRRDEKEVTIEADFYDIDRNGILRFYKDRDGECYSFNRDDWISCVESRCGDE